MQIEYSVGQELAEVLGWIRVRLAFTILKESVLFCIFVVLAPNGGV